MCSFAGRQNIDSSRQIELYVGASAVFYADHAAVQVEQK